MDNFKSFYQSFFEGKENELHFTAHSHHFWPDITKTGVLKCYQDTQKLVDQKWDKFFQEVIPQTRSLIGNILNLNNPKKIAFAPNTHELLFRLLSCFFEKEKVRVLTTDSEFHSFDRQINRLAEWDRFEIIKVKQDSNLEEELKEKSKEPFDLIFLSHVFYNTGKVLSDEIIDFIIQNKHSNTLFVLDGYHSFCALPLSLKKWEEELFYLAGSYKYAQAGEGLCFMTIPSHLDLRPLNTGWFAHFESLSSKSDQVSYAKGGDSFWGATQDMTPFYRFNEVWSLFLKKDITVQKIHQHVLKIQELFIKEIKIPGKLINKKGNRGHFLAYEFQTEQEAKQFEEELKEEKVFIDRRNKTIRFGFAPYHDLFDVDLLKKKI